MDIVAREHARPGVDRCAGVLTLRREGAQQRLGAAHGPRRPVERRHAGRVDRSTTPMLNRRTERLPWPGVTVSYRHGEHGRERAIEVGERGDTLSDEAFDAGGGF